jgi:TfoX/Sxy family transcriptional regulator of competence genes
LASDRTFVEFVVERLDEDCGVTFKSMFGEYGLCSGGKMFGMICDNQLFFKPTAGGRDHIGDVVEAPPYPGAKLIFLIGDQIEDPSWLSELVRITPENCRCRSRRRRVDAFRPL